MTERSRQHGKRQQVEIVFASLKPEFRLGETLARKPTGLATRIAAKIAVYNTYGFLVTEDWGVLKATSRSFVGVNLTTHGSGPN